MKKTLQSNIVMNDSYDTRQCYTHSLVSYRPFTAVLVWSVFFSILPKCLFVVIVNIHISMIFHKVV